MMRLLLTILLASAAACLEGQRAFAQGYVAFVNSSSTRIYLPDGQPVPRGSTFHVELMYAHDGTPDEAFDLIAVRLATTSFNSVVPGAFHGGSVTAPTPILGGYGLFQVRSWETAFGASYAEAVAAGPIDGRYALAGKSPILRVDTGDPTQVIPPAEPVFLGFQGLTLMPVPEPSVTLLAIASLIGIAAHQFLRRPK